MQIIKALIKETIYLFFAVSKLRVDQTDCIYVKFHLLKVLYALKLNGPIFYNMDKKCFFFSLQL